MDLLVSGELWVSDAQTLEDIKGVLPKLGVLWKCLPMCAMTSDRVPPERVLDVLVFPFLKLAKHINQLAGNPHVDPNHTAFSEAMYDSWAMALFFFLGCQHHGKIGVTMREAELKDTLSAMVNAKFPEVCAT